MRASDVRGARQEGRCRIAHEQELTRAVSWSMHSRGDSRRRDATVGQGWSLAVGRSGGLAGCGTRARRPSNSASSSHDGGAGRRRRRRRSPITIAYVTSDRPGRLPERDVARRLQRPARPAERPGRGERPQARPPRHRRPDEPVADRDRRAETRSKGVRHRLDRARCSSWRPSTPSRRACRSPASLDGPEWGQQPYTNMFAADNGSVDPKYPVNTLLGNFMKQHGGTVLGSYGYSISPSSSRAAIGTARLVPARRRQGRRARHHRPLRRRRLHQRRPRRQAEAHRRHGRPWTPTPTTPWPRRSSRPE